MILTPTRDRRADVRGRAYRELCIHAVARWNVFSQDKRQTCRKNQLYSRQYSTDHSHFISANGNIIWLIFSHSWYADYRLFISRLPDEENHCLLQFGEKMNMKCHVTIVNKLTDVAKKKVLTVTRTNCANDSRRKAYAFRSCELHMCQCAQQVIFCN